MHGLVIGVDNIDVDAATRHGVVVTYVPDYCVEEVAAHAVAMALSLLRKISAPMPRSAMAGGGWAPGCEHRAARRHRPSPVLTAGDWEVELDSPVAGRVIFGYVAAADVSERDWQMARGGQWSKDKSFPTAHPIGPWLVTADEIELDAELDLPRTVSGQRRQGNTRDTMFRPDHIIWHVSQFAELRSTTATSSTWTCTASVDPATWSGSHP